MVSVTSTRSLIFVRDLVHRFAREGASVVVVSNEDPIPASGPSQSQVRHIAVAMRRELSPIRDFEAFIEWVALLVRIRPDFVIAGTPKASLLGLAASWLVRVPTRTYLQFGIRAEGETGMRRRLLLLAEKATCGFATDIIAVSDSLRSELIELSLTPGRKVRVLGSGSSHGVDSHRFRPASQTERVEARETLGIPEDSRVVLYVGRLTGDKGVAELLDAWSDLASRRTNDVLLIVGEYDGTDSRLRRKVEETSGVHAIGYLANPVAAYWASDLMVLPTHREGMPNVLLEAASCGLPVVTTRATGARDAVVDGETGVVVPVSDSRRLAQAITRLLDDPDKRRSMGAAGRVRMVGEFETEAVTSRLFNEIAGPQDYTLGENVN